MIKIPKILFIILLTFFSCQRRPVGPDFNAEQKLAVFCILNNETQTQQLKVSRTLTFNETESNGYTNTNIGDAQIEFTGADCRIISISDATIHSSESFGINDFLWSTWDYNVLLQPETLEPGRKYSLRINSKTLGTATASTVMPGPFEITNWGAVVDSASEPCHNSAFAPAMHIEWDASAGAYGYLVDAVVKVYDFTDFYQRNEYDPGNAAHIDEERVLLTDSAVFVNLPYTAIPVRFSTNAGVRVRGILTQENRIVLPVSAITDFKYDTFDKNRAWLGLDISVYALSKSLYDYTTFQYLNLGDQRVVGQRSTVPDVSNIKGGTGVFGAAASAHVERIMFWPLKYLNWGAHWDSTTTSWKNHILWGSEGWRSFAPAPRQLEPPNDWLSGQNDSLRFEWSEIANPFENSTMRYILSLRPVYGSFHGGQIAFLADETHLTIKPDLKMRDCEIQWKVKGVLDFPELFTNQIYDYMRQVSDWVAIPYDPRLQFILSPGDADELYAGYFLLHNLDVTIKSDNGSSGINFQHDPNFLQTTSWSGTRRIIIPSGRVDGFENEKSLLVSPINDATLESGDSLRWQEVNGADAYLLFLESKTGETCTTVSFTTSAAPPFHKYDFIEGLDDLEKFPSGSEWSWSVCALRLESGMMGFVVNQTGDLPTASPRYEHPSGIFQQSQWTTDTFVVQ